MFFSFYKHTDDRVFDDFPKISDHFPKISQNCSEGQTNVPERFPRIYENSRRCPNIAEDCQRLSRKTRRCFDDIPTIWSTIWRLRWKKGARFFTQDWTLSKTLQNSHAVLFRCVKQCSVGFFPEVFFVYEILRMQKSLYLWSHQHVTGKMVI